MDQQTNSYPKPQGAADFLDRFDVETAAPGADRDAPLSLSERRKVLVEWNRTRQTYPRDRCFHQLFEAQVERSPEAIAVESDGDRLTYEELNDRANRLAHYLSELGVGPDVLVGICLHPSLDLLVSLLGVLKAGGAYVPLDPTYPQDRLDYMIADSGMKVLISHSEVVDSLTLDNVRVVCADKFLELPGVESTNPTSNVQPENLAYVIYTSGSTGRPKGVMIPHRGLVNYLCWAAEAYGVSKGSGALVHSSISFDLTITGLFAPLLVGRCVYLLPAEKSVESLARALESGADFSLIKITPAHLEMLCLQSPAAPSARAFIIGGEALFGENVSSWQRCASESLLVNEYGPTETVVGCCVFFIPRGRHFAGAIPIGRPIANTQLYVLNPSREPVAIGDTGELYIAGDGVARGYWNQPELTTEKFVDNPFIAEDENASPKMYRTGDLVRYLPDGNMEFLGRIDEQIKIRGYRIEPAEIEVVLLSHSLVRHAVVMTHADAAGDKQLAGYVVAMDGVTPSANELRSHLKTKLPDYMIPATFTALPDFPLTPNGKVDRRALPPPEVATIARLEYVAPETETEQKLAGIWRSSLQRQVGLNDNFFELGGHSLMAVRLVALMNEAFATNLDALTFYQHPTVHELAALLYANKFQAGGARFIRVREGTGGPAVIFLNPPLEFIRLANLMQGDESFYISEVPFAKGVIEAALRFDSSAFPTLAEMVAPHAALIRESGLSAPFFLAGYSSYGMVAFEVAHLLHEAGMPTAGVFLFDADMKPPRSDMIKVWTLRHARKVREQGLGYLVGKVRGRLQRSRDQQGLTPATTEAHAPDASLSNGDLSWRVFQRIWDHALRHYRPRPLAAPGVLFRAQVSIYGDMHDYDGCLGWRDVFREGLKIIEIPGDHVSMWKEPDVLALKQSWERALGKLRCTASAVLCSAPTFIAAIACSV